MALKFEFELEDDDEEGEEDNFGLEAFMAAQSAKDVHERHLIFHRNIHNNVSQPIPILVYFFSSSHFYPCPSPMKDCGFKLGRGEIRFSIFTQDNTFREQRFAVSLSFFFSFFARWIRLGGAFCFGCEEFFHFLFFVGGGGEDNLAGGGRGGGEGGRGGRERTGGDG